MFRKYLYGLLLPLAFCLSCTQMEKNGSADDPAKLSSTDDISRLSDEFGSPKTLPSWHQVYATEGWGANQLEGFDINQTQAGMMRMMPYASTWYQDYRGVLAYKRVKGDFVVTTKLRVSRRGGDGPPRAQFSLAGILIRTPRNITPQTWTPGGENYVFLSLGAADTPNRYQLEVKTTTNSNSQLEIAPVDSGEALIQVARIGSSMITLHNFGGAWRVHRRYYRPDFPEVLQAGLTCYTDWPTASSLSPQQHNATVIQHGNPDLVALFDYVRYRRPKVPANLVGQRLDNPQVVSDQALLRFLGASAN